VEIDKTGKELSMPHISLSLYPGRSREEIEMMCRNLQQCLVQTAGWKPDDISVSVEGIGAEAFAAKVKSKMQNETIVISSDYIR
jgi:phenylpyruvate tautomerase PptA (4-oxalocrotonate tautomerase family)